MVTGYALVLYLHLRILIKNERMLRVCLGVIVCIAPISHTPVIIACVYDGVHRRALLTAGFRLDILFSLQETAFALLYIHSFLGFMSGGDVDRRARSVLIRLFSAELVAFIANVVPVSLLYAGAYVPREAIHPFCYAIKLSAVLWMLDDLTRFSRARQGILVESPSFTHIAQVDHVVENVAANERRHSTPVDLSRVDERKGETEGP